jgi:hypothetical protein
MLAFSFLVFTLLTGLTVSTVFSMKFLLDPSWWQYAGSSLCRANLVYSNSSEVQFVIYESVPNNDYCVQHASRCSRGIKACNDSLLWNGTMLTIEDLMSGPLYMVCICHSVAMGLLTVIIALHVIRSVVFLGLNSPVSDNSHEEKCNEDIMISIKSLRKEKLLDLLLGFLHAVFVFVCLIPVFHTYCFKSHINLLYNGGAIVNLLHIIPPCLMLIYYVYVFIAYKNERRKLCRLGSVKPKSSVCTHCFGTCLGSCFGKLICGIFTIAILATGAFLAYKYGWAVVKRHILQS